MNGLIVVGVDGSDQSKTALQWALEEARLRGASVRVERLVEPSRARSRRPAARGRLGAPAPLGGGIRRELRRKEVDTSSEVEVTAVAVHGTPADVLVQSSKGADLLVVGSRGHGGFAGLLLGSVSQQCVHHATCPVVIVRGSKVEQDEAAEHETGAVRSA